MYIFFGEERNQNRRKASDKASFHFRSLLVALESLQGFEQAIQPFSDSNQCHGQVASALSVESCITIFGLSTLEHFASTLKSADPVVPTTQEVSRSSACKERRKED